MENCLSINLCLKYHFKIKRMNVFYPVNSHLQNQIEIFYIVYHFNYYVSNRYYQFCTSLDRQYTKDLHLLINWNKNYLFILLNEADFLKSEFQNL